jgi:serine/threonine-protein kinase
MVLAPGSRPLPEYDLVRRLGQGGFGEVWQAKGPGGFDVALKFIRLDAPAGPVELRALELVKGIRHAHLLSMFGAWQQDGFLILAMELADGTLRDRLQKAQAEGLPGIPPGELLEYMGEAAKGLDYLNERHHPAESTEPVGIQHKDVKPENLLLVGGTVKVADFGLARFLEHTVTSASGGMTPAYAAPEFFGGQVTRWSDQYSLGVTYCGLRGGRLPFTGDLAKVMAGHLGGPPDLSMLPEGERPAVARALSKQPQ